MYQFKITLKYVKPHKLAYEHWESIREPANLVRSPKHRSPHLVPHWKRNLIVLCGAQFLTLTGFSAYMPFMPYYVQELGVESNALAVAWLAAYNTGGAIAMMVSAPIWGSLADRVGRKPMVVRATLAGAVFALGLSLTQTPLQLVVVRILQGIFCGTVSAAITLVATETPDEYLGRGLGAMQAAQYVAFALGPMVGGVAADGLGYRAVFLISGVMMLVAAVAIAALAREGSLSLARRRHGLPRLRLGRQALAALTTRSTLALLMIKAGGGFAVAVLSPVLSLYIQALSPGNPRLATLAGAVVAASSVTSSVAALVIGHLGDRFGQKAVLQICAVGAALIYVPQALVASASQLLLLRAMLGVFMGGMLPMVNALLAQRTAPSRRGVVFGLGTSARSAGRAAGPPVGAAAANAWGMPSAFLVASGVFVLLSVIVATLVPAHPAQDAAEVRRARHTPRMPRVTTTKGRNKLPCD